MASLGTVCDAAGDFDEAKSIFKEAEGLLRSSADELEKNNLWGQFVLRAIGRTLLTHEQYDEAEPVLRQCLSVSVVA